VRPARIEGVVPVTHRRYARFNRWALLGLALVLACTPRGSTPGSDGGYTAPCTDTCQSTGQACGTVCGVSCGSCAADEQGHVQQCLAGRCRCLPACDGDRAGKDDGCGGTCPDRAAVSCADCPLRLVRESVESNGEVVNSVRVRLEASSRWARAPHLASLLFEGSVPLELAAVETGYALSDAGKSLYRYTRDNQPWQRRENGQLELLVTPGPRNQPIAAGTWLTLTFRQSSAEPVAGPWSVRLVRHDDLVAPAEARQALLETAMETPLVVRPVRGQP